MDSAFVICQLGSEDSDTRRRADEIFDYVVKPVTEQVQLRAHRSDQDPTPGQLTVQIVRALTSARVVIADLTGRNPNVYYELGVAHAFGIPVVILVDAAESLSFDTSTERVIEIGRGERLGVADADRARKKLSEALRVVLADDYKPSSLVSEAAGTRSLDELAPDNPIAQELAYMRDRLDLIVRQTQVIGDEVVRSRAETEGPVVRSKRGQARMLLARTMHALRERGWEREVSLSVDSDDDLQVDISAGPVFYFTPDADVDAVISAVAEYVSDEVPRGEGDANRRE